MTTARLTPLQMAAVRRIRASMAIEGFEWSEAQAIEHFTRYFERGEDERIERLVEQAKREGRPYLEVIREHFGRPRGEKA